MYSCIPLEELGLPPDLIDKLAMGVLTKPLALSFPSAYNCSEAKRLLYKLRRNSSPGTFRVSDRGIILVLIPRNKPTPSTLEGIEVLKLPGFQMPQAGGETVEDFIKYIFGETE